MSDKTQEAYKGRFIAVDPPLHNGKWRVGAPGDYGVAGAYLDLSLGALAVYPENYPEERAAAIAEFLDGWQHHSLRLVQLIAVLDDVIEWFCGPLPNKVECRLSADAVGKQAALCRAWLDCLEQLEPNHNTATVAAGPLLVWRRYYHALAILMELDPQVQDEQAPFLASWNDLDHEYQRALGHWSNILLDPMYEWFVVEVLAKRSAQDPSPTPACVWEDEVKALARLPDGRLRCFFYTAPGQHWLERLTRRWLLPRYDLTGVSQICQECLPLQHLPAWISWLLSYFYRPVWHQPWLMIVITALLLVLSRWLGLFSLLPALILGMLTVGLAIYSSIQGKLGRLAFYPFSLRLTVSSIVGLLALSGLTEQFNDFAFNAFGGPYRTYTPATTILVLSGALLSTWLYLFVSASSRLNDFNLAWSRAWRLLIFGWAQSTISAAFFAWLGAGRLFPLGLEDKPAPLHAMPFLGSTLYFDYLVVAGILAFTVGAFTQILWEEKTATEPL